MRSLSQAGGQILPKAADIYAAADMIIKVKEPLEPEYDLSKEGQIIFAYLHLALKENRHKLCYVRKLLVLLLKLCSWLTVDYRFWFL